MSSEPIIEACGLGKAYPIYRRPEDRLKQLLWGRRRRYYQEFWAVRDVDLTVGRGETVGVIGRNGSGKSTLLQMICGTLRPSAGEVRVRGRVAAMLELGSGFNPQFTGRENVRVGASVLGLSAGEIDARFDSILSFADIGAFIDQPMRHYSSGMHARLAFAVCANVDADVLIVDEVLSVGDAAFQQKCMRFLNRFRMHGTLLFVSHDSGAVVKLCDRALWLDQGDVRGLGDAKEICRLYLAAQAEDGADNAGRFRLGGRGSTPRAKDSTSSAVPGAPREAVAADAGNLVFDAEDVADPEGGAEIESITFYDPSGARLQVAAGGEAVELHVVCRAWRALTRIAIVFVVRDRLGQILFSDDAYNDSCSTAREISAGQSLAAKFAFLLPYLASGAYAVEAFAFEMNNGRFAMLDHRSGREFLHIQSVHPSSGLANIAMRAVSLDVVMKRARRSSSTTDVSANLSIATEGWR
ncbi:MAG: ABC transporter ATP-binding protein [Rhizomicrobium sp.]